MRPTIDGLRRRSNRIIGRVRSMGVEAIVEGNYPWSKAHPASFKQWTRRAVGRPNGDFPPVWRIDKRLPFDKPSSVVAVIHVYYPDLVHEIVSKLANIPVDLDVIVTNASGSEISDSRFVVGNVRNVVVLEVENHGRDIFPLIQVVNAGLLDPYRLVLKTHTKKSQWREGHGELSGDGESWKDQFLESLLGSEESVEEILSAFSESADLGVVTAPGNILGPEFWGGDKYLTQELARRLEFELDLSALQFPAGSMYWCRAFILQGLRGLNLTRDDFDEESGQIDATTAHAIERLIGVLTLEAGLRLATTAKLPRLAEQVAEASAGASKPWRRYEADAELSPSARFIPFYLPQFHPSPKNDIWWGEGFTEWTNVSNSQPVFPGHRQPLLPGSFGFYDLRNDLVRESQLELAEWSGISGFMYYYYWFAGERLLNLPIERLRAQTDLDQPYCIMWANENWTRAWDGRSKDVLVGQDYSKVPAEAFVEDIAEFLKDPRYMRVDGKAVLSVYRPGQMANFAEVVATWRERARQMGIGELFILSVNVAKEFDGLEGSISDYGLDGTMDFPPHRLPWKPAPSHRLGLDPRFRGNVVSYFETAKAGIRRAYHLEVNDFPGVMVSFDNTARRQWKSDVWWGSNPYTFHRWLREAVRAISMREPEHRIVFINAWNEWAESAVLEPTQRWGLSYLQAVRNIAFS